jgi:hypothetical protein
LFHIRAGIAKETDIDKSNSAAAVTAASTHGLRNEFVESVQGLFPRTARIERHTNAGNVCLFYGCGH